MGSKVGVHEDSRNMSAEQGTKAERDVGKRKDLSSWCNEFGLGRIKSVLILGELQMGIHID